MSDIFLSLLKVKSVSPSRQKLIIYSLLVSFRYRAMNPTELKYDNRIDFLKKYLFKMDKLIFYEFFITLYEYEQTTQAIQGFILNYAVSILF